MTNNKVWLVAYNNYSDSFIHGIYSSKQKAEVRQRQLIEKCTWKPDRERYAVEEYVLDEDVGYSIITKSW